jgi:hypothetical protein
MAEPRVLRAHRSDVHSPRHSSGHQADIHPEDVPYHTTTEPSRKAVCITYADDQDGDTYTERRMPTVVKRYPRSPITTRVQEEPIRVRVTPLRFFLIAVGIILLAFVLALLIITFLIPSLQQWNDDRTYGYPRTTHTRANVGHGTNALPYSDFTGENIDGYIYVFEVEETDPSQRHPQAYFITRFSGAQKDQIAVSDISFIDENGDGKVDMLVTMENGSIFVL